MPESGCRGCSDEVAMMPPPVSPRPPRGVRGFLGVLWGEARDFAMATFGSFVVWGTVFNGLLPVMALLLLPLYPRGASAGLAALLALGWLPCDALPGPLRDGVPR